MPCVPAPVVPCVPSTPAATKVHAVNVPPPPLLVTVNTNVFEVNEVISPSMKLVGVIVLNTRTRSPTVNAVAVFAKLVVKVFPPELVIAALVVEVNPA